MPSKSKLDTDEDMRMNSIKKNPCGICRAAGVPLCKGHGGKGGGGGSGSSTDESQGLSGAQPAPLSLKPLEKSFKQSPLWLQPDNWELIFQLENPEALILVKLDMEKGWLHFSNKQDLSGDEQQSVTELLNTIKDEFEQFKKELSENGISVTGMSANRQRNSLTLKISDPQYFDSFVQRLIDKNLLTIQPLPEQKKMAGGEKLIPEVIKTESPYQSTAPTPFDMVPKPNGFEDKKD